MEEAWKNKVAKKGDIKYSEALTLMVMAPEFSEICFVHRRQLASKFGIRTAKTSEELTGNLETILDGSDDPWDLKTVPETYRLFKPSHRPPRSTEALGPYRFPPPEEPPYKPAADDLKKGFRRIFRERAIAGWEETKATTLRGGFSWLWEGEFDIMTIANVAQQESAMYRHHMRLAGREAKIAVPILLYSLVQQLVRQDPAIYRLTVTLRPDHAWRLISYPCFLRGMLPEEDTAPNLVQGAVPIPDKEWDDNWQRGEIRMFMNKKGNTANYLPTAAPGFLAVADDLSTLEFPGLGTVEDLSWAHTQLTLPSRYPTESAHKYKELRIHFPVAMGLTSLGAFSDALVGRQSWQSALVLHEIGVVLGNQQEAEWIIETWRQQAVQQVVRAFRLQREREKGLYQEQSYYGWVENHPDEEGDCEMRGEQGQKRKHECEKLIYSMP